MSSPTPAEAEAAIALLNRVYIDGYSASVTVNCYLGQSAVSEYVMLLTLVFPFYWWSMWFARLWQPSTRLYFAFFVVTPFLPWIGALLLSDLAIQETAIHPFCTSKQYALPPVVPSVTAFLLGMTLVHTRYFALPFPLFALAINVGETALVPFLLILNGVISLHQAAAGVAWGFACVVLVAVPFYLWLVPFLFRVNLQEWWIARQFGVLDVGRQIIKAEAWSIL